MQANLVFNGEADELLEMFGLSKHYIDIVLNWGSNINKEHQDWLFRFCGGPALRDAITAIQAILKQETIKFAELQATVARFQYIMSPDYKSPTHICSGKKPNY